MSSMSTKLPQQMQLNKAFTNGFQIKANEEELINMSNVAVLADTLRCIERDKIYYSDSIVENKTRAFRIIQKLLDAYVPAVLNYRSSDSAKDTADHILYLSFSENYRYICERANK